MSTDPRSPRLSRRDFLVKGSLFLASAGLFGCADSLNFPGNAAAGTIAGADWKTAHMLMEQDRPFSSHSEERTGIVIVGGGVAGLSAARELRKKGMNDFLLLELSDRTGGNAANGRNAVSAYPWGAHYIPIPGPDAVLVRELFEELGVITGYDSRRLPVYNEYYLCADPQERLFINGQWQEGLVPRFAIPDADRRELRSFLLEMARFRAARGSDGKRAFAIPVDQSSRDSRYTGYDGITMAAFLADQGWNSPYLRWYVNYCCRDDYGCRIDEVSAWAGIHYFASRDGKAANAEPHAVLTWPEGIGWVTGRMSQPVRENIRANACVMNIESAGNELAVDYFDARQRSMKRISARSVIYAAPRFTAFRVLKDFRRRRPGYARALEYSPWVVANATVKGLPSGKGAPLCWDNVSFYGDSLGYVAATHQDIGQNRDQSVLTYYRPLTAGAPSEERAKALRRSYSDWAAMVLKDLSQMHPGIEKTIEQLDVWVWGHAMARPLPGFIWGRERQSMLAAHGRISFAHSDMSGISIFEEAHSRGVLAAREAMGSRGRSV